MKKILLALLCITLPHFSSASEETESTGAIKVFDCVAYDDHSAQMIMKVVRVSDGKTISRVELVFFDYIINCRAEAMKLNAGIK